MPAAFPLDVLAGADALREIRDGGLAPSHVRAIVGASGGPKWIVLRGLDRVLFPWLLDGASKTGQTGQPVHAVGSSIGAWRMACLCMSQPLPALERLEQAYVEDQRYGTRKPSAAEVSAQGARILSEFLGSEGTTHMLANARMRLHIVTSRFRHIGALEGRAQIFGLGLAATLNVIGRTALGVSVERVVFDAQNDPGPFAPWQHLPTRHVALTAGNARAALAASGAIPMVMQGVRDPEGAPPGIYRDGGVADYHFGSEIDAREGLTLYPHFYSHLVPGYFDKSLGHRRTRGLRRTVVLAPSAAFVASLPFAKIPDREDFLRIPEAERLAAWRIVLARSRELGEAFAELVASGRIREHVRPLQAAT